MPHILTKLELNGFKSFAGKTEFEFPAGITAIVGPNGSGKSNIIDAVRWLLGERDARSLRGGTVEDLVFAGTPKRPRVGQARASITFDNREKFLPVDYEEVSVSRRVSRGGDSRYFINNSEVRLKDIAQFFAQGRLGSRGLTVITQGKSDMFISATPKERREMIEEALGLKEYQLKKAEAERRLSSAGTNLEKVEALVEEILPHLRSLKRQTNRWEKRGEIENELSDLETAFFGSQWNVLSGDLKGAEEDIQGHNKEKEALVLHMERSEGSLKEIENEKPQEQEALQRIREERETLLHERGTLEKEAGRLEAEKELQKRALANGKGSVAATELLSTLERVKGMLENPEGSLEEVVKHAVREIGECLRRAKGESTDDALSEELLQKFRDLEERMKGIEEKAKRLKEEERKYEEKQDEFYGTFKDAVQQVEEARRALDRWEQENRDKILKKERILLRKEELVRQVTQAGRSMQEFEDISPDQILEKGQWDATEKRLFRLRGDLAAMGEVDEAVMKEARETEERYEFLKRESEDLRKAEADLTKLIAELSDKIHKEFRTALLQVNKEFQKFFELMFGGGKAKLAVKEDNPTEPVPEADEEMQEEVEVEEEAIEAPQREPGVEIRLSLPRKKVSSLDALSGGERSLVGIAMIFALVSVSPPPFLVLDEIDAALDDRNARRFAELLREFSKRTQFVVVTHNRATMEAADILYGITLDEDGSSKVVSMKLGE